MSEQTRTLAEALASRRLLGFAAVQTVDAAPGPAGGPPVASSKTGAAKIGTGKLGSSKSGIVKGSAETR